MSKLEIIELVVLLVVVVGLAVFYLIKAIKNHWFKELLTTLENAIKEAEEKFPKGHGDEKKKFVMDAIKNKCEELGIPYIALEKLINKIIDDYIKKYNLLAK